VKRKIEEKSKSQGANQLMPKRWTNNAPDHSNWHCVGVYTPKRYRQL